MEDRKIVDLYWQRSENAIAETAAKYDKYCHAIAYNILSNIEDSEECVNDTYMQAWNSMPPKRPSVLKAFLGKITRNLSLNRYEYYNAEKRGAGQTALALDELRECIPAGNNADEIIDDIVLKDVLNRFIASLPKEKRIIFMRRYWYMSSIAEIAADCSVSESKVKMSLMRSRDKLKKLFEKEGISI